MSDGVAPSKGAWTPGPWHYTRQHEFFSIRSGSEDDWRAIAETLLPAAIDEANALLISKCPDLADYVWRQAEKGDDEARALYEALSR